MSMEAQTGNFVAITPAKSGTEVVHGIVTGFARDNGIFIDIFDYGFPFGQFFKNCFEGRFYWTPEGKDFNVEKLSLPQFLGHLEQARDRIIPKKESKDLVAACWASREHYLNGVIAQLVQGGTDLVDSWNLKPRFPETGLYVVHSGCFEDYHCDINPESTNLEAVLIEPRVTPNNAARILTAWYGRFRSVTATHPGATGIGYFCHEVPESARSFVKDPLVIKGPSF